MAHTQGETSLAIFKTPHVNDLDLPSAPLIFAEARQMGQIIVLLKGSMSPEDRRHRAKRRHDLKASLRTLNLMVAALKDGYRFEDAQAEEKIAAISRAIANLDKEADFLDQILTID